MTEYVIDLETDNLLPYTKYVWCIGLKEVDKDNVDILLSTTESINRINKILNDPESLIIGHNIIAFDLRVLKKLYNIDTTCQVFDTLVWSSLLYPDRRGGHSLASWGERFHYPKGDFNDWSRYSNEMAEYCKQDVRLTERVYHRLREEMDR